MRCNVPFVSSLVNLPLSLPLGASLGGLVAPSRVAASLSLSLSVVGVTSLLG